MVASVAVAETSLASRDLPSEEVKVRNSFSARVGDARSTEAVRRIRGRMVGINSVGMAGIQGGRGGNEYDYE